MAVYLSLSGEVLLCSQSFHRVDPSSSLCRQVAGCQRHRKQQCWHSQEGDGVTLRSWTYSILSASMGSTREALRAGI